MNQAAQAEMEGEMDSKHTPGPWEVVIVSGSYKRPAFVKSGDKIVAECTGNQLDPAATSIGEATANARLIAAAPELRAALRIADQWLQAAEFAGKIGGAELEADRAQIRAAIAKAGA